MADYMEALQEILKKKKTELQEVINKIAPLEKQRVTIQEDIKACERLITSEAKGVVSVLEQDRLSLWGSLVGMSPINGYKAIVQNHFTDSAFREGEIREIAKREGVSVRGKEMPASYSRTILVDLVRTGFLKRVDRGLFQRSFAGELDKIDVPSISPREPIRKPRAQTIFGRIRKALESAPEKFTRQELLEIVNRDGEPPVKKETFGPMMSRLVKEGEVLLVEPGVGTKPGTYKKAPESEILPSLSLGLPTQ